MPQEIQVNLLDYFTNSNKYVDDAGFLRTTGVIGRVGVQEYTLDVDGEKKSLRVFRPPQEVEKSAFTFRNKPQSVDHPASGEITADNSNEIVGHLGEVIYKDGLLVAEQIFHKKDAFEKIKSTHKYNSSGYKATVVFDSGKWIDELGIMGKAGQKYDYDAYQKDIKGNHNAAVEFPRAGEIAAINLDSVDSTHSPGEVISTSINCCIVDCSDDPLNTDPLSTTIEGSSMDKATNSTTTDSSTTAPPPIATAPTNSSNASSEVANQVKIAMQDTKIEELTSTIAKLQIQLAEKEKTTTTTEVTTTATDSKDIDINKVISERVKLWNKVLPQIQAIDSAFTPDYNLDTADILRTHLSKRYPGLADSLKDKSSDYLQGAFELVQLNDAIAQEREKQAIDEERTREEEKPKPSVLTDALYSINRNGGSANKGIKEESDGTLIANGLTDKRKNAKL